MVSEDVLDNLVVIMYFIFGIKIVIMFNLFNYSLNYLFEFKR